ncbi:MAG TPA: efflux RND transporter periplasmic adaptor subunit [Candidatus Paceibacterota bacterium]|nr:efflux RND transporter periplasmic adaptor subunit [Candidatus Paceibacterota bacterium]
MIFSKHMLTKKRFLIPAAVVVIAGGFILYNHTKKPSYHFVTVTRGSITQTVSVTGNTTPAQSVQMGFQSVGVITHVYRKLGDTVHQGEVVAALDTGTLSAAVAQAQATVDQQKASLAALQAGTTPQQLTVDETAVANAQTALSNTIQSSYIQVQDAIKNKITPFFSTVSTNKQPITLSGQYYDLLGKINAALDAWGQTLLSTSSSQTPSVTDADTHLAALTALVGQVNSAVTTLLAGSNYDATTVQTLQGEITTAALAVANAKTAIDTAQATLSAAQGTLLLAQAGPTADAITAAQAQVAQAEAGLASAQVGLQHAEIIAPIDGVITQQDAKIGELATVGAPLVSVIGNGGFEVDAGVSETDVGKLAVGDPVSMTFDAFQNETFTGKVFYIAPAATNNQGVITYLTKVSFDAPDARIKSGLTANLDIQTDHKDNVLLLPEYAIVQNDQGTFVEVVENNTVKQMPVTLGIQDQNGTVEVSSGVDEGEQVLNVGLKT